jgi:hypothetical protein
MPERQAAGEGNEGRFLSMRVLGAFTLTMALTTGAVNASSFVVMGEAAPASTPSIVTLGEPLPEVTDEKVAAIPQKPRRNPTLGPLVIRGGVVGGSFAPASSTPSPAIATGTPSAPNKAAASHDKSPQAPPSPAPATPPPALAPRAMPR